MRLRLEDSPGMGKKKLVRLIKKQKGQCSTLYNPDTGVGVVMEPEEEGLGSIFTKLLPKTTQKKIKMRQDSKLRRLDNRLKAKEGRQQGRAKRKMTRIKGSIAKVKKKAENKLKELDQEQAQTWQPTPSPESDQFPEDFYDVPGGDFETEEQAEEDDYEQMPEGGYDDEDYEGEDYESEEYEQAMYDNGEIVPMGGWVDSVFDFGKKLLGPKASSSTAVQTVTKAASQVGDYDRLKKEVQKMKAENKRLQTNTYLYTAGGTVAGIIGGVLISKALK